jgi:hypothetical protein
MRNIYELILLSTTCLSHNKRDQLSYIFNSKEAQVAGKKGRKINTRNRTLSK